MRFLLLILPFLLVEFSFGEEPVQTPEGAAQMETTTAPILNREGRPITDYVKSTSCDDSNWQEVCNLNEFCDPMLKTCVANVESSLRGSYSHNNKCAKNSDCGFYVCVREEKESKCYKNHLDYCTINGDCKQNSENKNSKNFCNVHVGGKRRFYCVNATLIDDQAVIWNYLKGLLSCSKNRDCNAKHNHYCEKNSTRLSALNVNIKGYCARNECENNQQCGKGEYCNHYKAEGKRRICVEASDPLAVLPTFYNEFLFCEKDDECHQFSNGRNVYCTKPTSPMSVPFPKGYGYCVNEPDFCNLTDYYGDHLQRCESGSTCSLNAKCISYDRFDVCCPETQKINKKEEPIVPYLTNITCDKTNWLTKCKIGAFCDPIYNKCVFHVGLSKRKTYALDKNCTSNDNCSFSVCVRGTSESSCYWNPLDQCSLNRHCKDGEFCNVHVDENTRYSCEKALEDRSIIERNRSGLIICYTARHCNSYQQNSIECMSESTSPNVIIPANMTGHCAFKVVLKCRGEPRAKFNEASASTCKINSECSSGEFCDNKALWGSRSSFFNFPDGVGICCSLPNTGGEIRNNKEVGLETCNLQKAQGCQDTEYCVTNFNRGHRDLWDSGDEGVCSKFQCTQLPKAEVSPDERVIAGDVCDSEASSDCKSDLTTVAVCEQFESETPHSRCCRYKRIVSQCDDPFMTEIRDENENAVSCEVSRQCVAHENSKCGAPKSPIPGIKKMCCEVQVCPDHFTTKVDSENSCTRDEECEENGMKGQCDGGYCCPIVHNLENVLEDPNVAIEVGYPFKTPVPCTKVADCEGEARFCDVVTNRCTYYGPLGEDVGGLCLLDELTCGDVDGYRTVCMLEMLPDQDDIVRCHRHPVDECKANTECEEGDYCGVALEVPFDSVGKWHRMCRKIPKGAVLVESGFGLKECKTDEECGEASFLCHLEDVGKRAYCKTVPLLVCHGKPLAKYVGRKQATCMKNSDCGENAFCDMDIERTEGFSKDDGVCCSVPEKCGGEAVTREEVGLSICQADDQCSIANGEICSKRFFKQPESRWTEQDGVCCKMICPNSTNIEAEKKTVLADKRCAQREDCSADASSFTSCIDAPEADYKRCCFYDRRKTLCPVGIGEVQRESGVVKVCDSNGLKCRGRGFCHQGVCCEPETCPDLQTEKYKERACSTEKDCQQAEGFAAECLGGYCCPQTTGEVLKEAFLSNIKCTSVSDCPYAKMYCHSKHGRCAYKLARTNEDLNLEGKCATKTSKDCKGKDGRVGICLYPNQERNGLPSCSLEAAAIVATEAPVEEEESNTGLIVGIIIGVIILVLVIAGIVGYVLYRKYVNKDKKKKLNRLALPTARSSPPKTSPKKPRMTKVATPSVHSTLEATESMKKNSQGTTSAAGSKSLAPASATSRKSSEHQQASTSSTVASAQSKPHSSVQSNAPRVSKDSTSKTTTTTEKKTP